MPPLASHDCHAAFRSAAADVRSWDPACPRVAMAVFPDLNRFTRPDSPSNWNGPGWYPGLQGVEQDGLYNELNLDNRISLTEDQVWRPNRDKMLTALTRKSGGTDAGFICTA